MGLYEKYRAQINSWDWDAIVREAEEHVEYDDFAGCYVGVAYLGSVFTLAPSGKYYMPWCSNFTEREAHRDEMFFEALEHVAYQHGGSISSGEGDPCDIYFLLSVEQPAEVLDEDCVAF